MEAKPLINVPPDSVGVGPKNGWDTAWPVKVEEKDPGREGSQSINLGLGIGPGSGRTSHVTKQGKSAFTPVQLHELQQQALVLKYIVAGLPVPFHLILPIWKSVARSFGSVDGGIYNQYPSFIGFSLQGFDCRSMMDPEPGRCRRTDGKKWRCSWDVAPDQKYCKRHMHRGRQRSRKHVEASAISSEFGTAVNSNNTTTTINPTVTINTKSDLSISIPVNLQLATPSSNTSSNTTAATAPTTAAATATASACISGIKGSDNNVVKVSNAATTALPTCNSNSESNKNVYGNKYTTTTTAGLISAPADNNDNSNSKSNNDSIDGKHASYSHLNKKINNVNNCKAGSFVAPAFGFSPKSVLQVVGSRSLHVDYRNVEETELQRCRRTDGKKWRCSRDVVPDEKYCGWHLHRGAKKPAVASQAVTVAAAPPPPPMSSVCYHAPPLAIPKKADGHTNLNTNLSISIAVSPQQMINEEGGPTGSSSSSDTTTITDENGSISHLLALSP